MGENVMYCCHCGQALKPDASFCAKCGADLRDVKKPAHVSSDVREEMPAHASGVASENAAGSMPAHASASNDAGSSAYMQQAQPIQQGQPKKPINKRAAIIAGAIAAAAAIIAILVFAVIIPAKQAAEAEEMRITSLAHQQYTVSVQADGYDPTGSSPIPMHIEGTSFDGSAVSLYTLCRGSGVLDTSLERGNYTVTVVASPFAPAGALYGFPAEGVQIEVRDAEVEAELAELNRQELIGFDDVALSGQAADASGDASGSSASSDRSGSASSPDASGEADSADGSADNQPATSITIAFTLIPALDCTDEQYAAAREALIQCGMQQAEADQFLQNAQEGKAKAAEHAAKRQEFQARYNAITSVDPWDAQDMMHARVQVSDYCRNLDILCDDVLDYLTSTMDEQQAAELRANQAAWEASAQAQADAQVPPDVRVSAQLDNSRDSIKRSYEARAQELVNMV